MNTDKLAINWQNFARVRLQLKFALNNTAQRPMVTTVKRIFAE